MRMEVKIKAVSAGRLVLIVGEIRHPIVPASGRGGLGTLVAMRVPSPASARRESIVTRVPRPQLLEHSSPVLDKRAEGLSELKRA